MMPYPEQLDEHAPVIDRAEHAVPSYAPAPAVLDALQLLGTRKRTGIGAAIELILNVRSHEQQRLSIERGELLYRSPRQFDTVAHLIRQPEIAFGFLPGHSRIAAILIHGLFQIERVQLVFEPPNALYLTCAENVVPLNSANEAIRSFSSGANRIADAVIAMLASCMGLRCQLILVEGVPAFGTLRSDYLRAGPYARRAPRSHRTLRFTCASYPYAFEVSTGVPSALGISAVGSCHPTSGRGHPLPPPW